MQDDESPGKRKLSVLEKLAIIIIAILIVVILLLIFNKDIQQYFEAFRDWYESA
jgi:hypothetical protein